MTRAVRAVCVCMVLLGARCALGQQSTPFKRLANDRSPGSAYIERAEFGWSGHLGVERWNPVTVWIADGGKGFSGVLSFTLAQDSTQECNILVPAAATPGSVVPVDLAVAIPRNFNRAKVALIDQSGRLIDSVEAVTTFPNREQIVLEYMPSIYGGPIVAIGPSSLLRTSLATSIPPPAPTPPWQYVGTTPPKPTPAEAWLNLRVAGIEPGRAPRLPIAYDGASAVVVHASSLGKMEPRAREALRQWLITGGRAVLVVDAPGAAWRTLLPAEPDFDLVTVADAKSVAMSAPLAQALASDQKELSYQAWRIRQPNWNDSDAPPPPGQPAEPDEAAERTPSLPTPAEPGVQDPAAQAANQEPVVPAAASINARSIAITPTGLRSEWKLLFTTEDGLGLVAAGPVGFGRLTVLGLDPEQTTQVLSRQATTAAWLSVLRDVAKAASERRPQEDYWVRAGDTVDQSTAIQASLNDLASGRNPSVLALVPVVGTALLLACLIGPVDAFLLKRLKARQRSWATALGWTALLTVVAAWLPDRIRTAPTTVDRIEMVDVRLPLEPGSTSVAATTGISSVFAGSAGEIRLEGYPPGAFVRGVSALAGSEMRIVLPPLTMFQSTRQIGDIQALTIAPDRLWVGKWTMRAALDQSSPQAVIGGRAERLPDGTLRFMLWGLPPASITDTWVECGSQTRHLLAGDTPDKQLGSIAADGRVTIDFPPSSIRPIADMNSQSNSATSIISAVGYPQVLERLPGAFERSRTITDLLASGRWAAVTLCFDASLTPLTSPDGPLSLRRFTALRVCVPLEAPAPAPAPETAP